jgi:PAS domain S-box-containing protein
MLYQRLLGSAEALQKIIDIIPSPVFVKDTRHRWVLINDALVAILGKPREALLGQTDFDVFAPDEAAAFWSCDDAVFASGQSAEDEERMTDASGSVRLILTRRTLLRVGPGNGTLFLVGIFTDITAYGDSLARSQFISRHDALTGLPNRTVFNEQLAAAVTLNQRTQDGVAVLLIDLDGFKAVNDAFGHAAGDALLRVIAGRLAAAVRGTDLVARIGGDEFGILVPSGSPPRFARW